MPQNGIQFFALGRDGLKTAIFAGVVIDNLAVIGVHIHIGNGGGHILLREQTA